MTDEQGETAPIMTIGEFCKWARIGHTKFYGLVKAGLGPKMIQPGGEGRHRFVRRDDAEEWLKKQQAV